MSSEKSSNNVISLPIIVLIIFFSAILVSTLLFVPRPVVVQEKELWRIQLGDYWNEIYHIDQILVSDLFHATNGSEVITLTDSIDVINGKSGILLSNPNISSLEVGDWDVNAFQLIYNESDPHLITTWFGEHRDYGIQVVSFDPFRSRAVNMTDILTTGNTSHYLSSIHAVQSGSTQAQIILGTKKGKILAYHLDALNLTWNTTIDPYDFVISGIDVLPAKEGVFAIGSDIHFLNSSTGEMIWVKNQNISYCQSALTIDANQDGTDDLILTFIESDRIYSTIIAIDGKDGAEIWRKSFTEPEPYRLSSNSDYLIGSDNSNINLINVSTGNILWSFPVKSLDYTHGSPPTTLLSADFVPNVPGFEIVFSISMSGNPPEFRNLFILSANGNLIWTYNLQVLEPDFEIGIAYLMPKSLVAADLTRDGSLELLIGTTNSWLLAFDF
ncbi:hypothetical protein CEE45_15190 [Candidatus Heimdallarchaeota archaeon B3_Heim]|nr:MAG: hypothetical protein CEE45_15190 [Candidatus Heimdallarchaeota archaeon B3_Heim]